MKTLLLLSKNETEILELVKEKGQATPLSLAKSCKIPRPTIYITLDKLKDRGLIRSRKLDRKKIWELTKTTEMREHIEDLKNVLTGDKRTYDKIQVTEDTDLTIHRGADAILNLFKKFAGDHNGKRLMGMSGNLSADAWKDTIPLSDINTINSKIKEQGLLTEMISSEGWFKQQARMFGKNWVENFIGRATQVHFIDNTYLDYSSQIFVFGSELYLVSMRERLFIEVKNKQIAALIISLLKFVEDKSKSVDINQILKGMIS